MQPDFRGSRRNDVCEDCRVAECKTSEHRDGVVLLPRAGCLVPSLTGSIADIYLSNETISEWKRGQSCDPVASRLPHVHMGCRSMPSFSLSFSVSSALLLLSFWLLLDLTPSPPPVLLQLWVGLLFDSRWNECACTSPSTSSSSFFLFLLLFFFVVVLSCWVSCPQTAG